MRVLILGATGMVGQGAVRECLRDPAVTAVVTLGRRSSGIRDAKVTDLVAPDLTDLTPVARQLTGLDACFYCLGTSSVGMSEADYTRVTYDLTMSVARRLCDANAGMTFIYVSGTGTDSTGEGRLMWARVKGRTENALLAMPFKAAYMFRPGVIQPLHGIKSSTKWTRIFYAATGPLLTVLRSAMPRWIITTEQIGRAMLVAATKGAPVKRLENRDIADLARPSVERDPRYS